MPAILGLDIGSNSVGSAWIDTDRGEITLGVSIFPAGVDEQEDKRGAPKNQARREARSQRRMLDRRSNRKRKLRQFLIAAGFLPSNQQEFEAVFGHHIRGPNERDAEFKNRKRSDAERWEPWTLRRRAVQEPLTPTEFGRVLIHLAQRRGALGVTSDPDDPDEGKVKEGMDRLASILNERGSDATIGQLMADLIDERRQSRDGASWNEPIRNRQYRIPEDQQLYAGRDLIRREFQRIVEVQRSFLNSELAGKLTDELLRQLDNPTQNDTWRQQGLIFGQRRTYWDTGTLGRCVLEPAERCVPLADRHASYFRVIETVNNIRVAERGKPESPLTSTQRDNVIAALRGKPLEVVVGKGSKATVKLKPLPKDVKPAHIRQLLRIDKTSLSRQGVPPESYVLNLENDADREINTDWFHREIVLGAIGEELWSRWEESEKREADLPEKSRSAEARRCEAINRAILKFNPDQSDDVEKLRAGAVEWWGFDSARADRLVAAWKNRPRLEKRLNLSRRAIINLLPLMDQFDEAHKRWPTQQEARKAHAKTLRTRFEETGDRKHEVAANRYETAALGLTATDRYYMRLPKHQVRYNGDAVRDSAGRTLAMLPPAPMVSNPVVRKAIHEVRRHVLAYLRKFRRKPDRVVIEFARGVKETTKRRNEQLSANRKREQERKSIEENLRAWGIPESNWKRAVLRVRLCREQSGVCHSRSPGKIPLASSRRKWPPKDGKSRLNILCRRRYPARRWTSITLCCAFVKPTEARECEPQRIGWERMGYRPCC